MKSYQPFISLPDELWKNISGFPDYKISSFGRCYSFLSETFLSPGRCVNGYMKFGLYNRNKKRVSILVHILVSEAFLGSRPKDLETNHKDGKRSNNKLDNLEYVTPSQNMFHAINSGNFNPRTNATLSIDDVRKIRDLRKSKKFTQQQVATMFNICRPEVSMIENNKHWKNVV